jgi:hypothetical protein
MQMMGNVTSHSIVALGPIAMIVEIVTAVTAQHVPLAARGALQMVGSQLLTVRARLIAAGEITAAQLQLTKMVGLIVERVEASPSCGRHS